MEPGLPQLEAECVDTSVQFAPLAGDFAFAGLVERVGEAGEAVVQLAADGREFVLFLFEPFEFGAHGVQVWGFGSAQSAIGSKGAMTAGVE
jgi:hypothetical protein